MEGILVLVRHGESLWNANDMWTGLTDIGLSQKGRREAADAANKLADISFSMAFTSVLSRAIDTLHIMLETWNQLNMPITSDPALNEKDYGIYTGKIKSVIKIELGETAFVHLRRGWDYPILEGESLKQVSGRVIPYYIRSIEPLVTSGKHVLVVSHGNTLRALMKYLEHISDEDIAGVELATGEIVVYKIDSSGAVVSKEKRTVQDKARVAVDG